VYVVRWKSTQMYRARWDFPRLTLKKKVGQSSTEKERVERMGAIETMLAWDVWHGNDWFKFAMCMFSC